MTGFAQNDKVCQRNIFNMSSNNQDINLVSPAPPPDLSGQVLGAGGLLYYIAIEQIPGVGSILAKRLIAYCGSAEAVFTEKQKSLQKIPGVGDMLSREIVQQNVLQRAEQELKYIEKNNIAALCYTDDNYPERLRQCEDSPVVLFVKGNINFNQQKFISIVGTRRATNYGHEICNHIVAQLAERGHKVVIVSGLAYGIDICAHRAALQNKLETVAVMATGLDKIYPSTHASYAKQITEQGACVSDFLSGTPLDRKNFLKRNRIIAGLSDATLIVESGAKGGALVTADIAMSYNRDVLAVPGRVNDSFSEGCNALIKQNKAALVESAADIEYALGWSTEGAPKIPKQLPLFHELTEEEQLIVNTLKKVETENIDTLSYATNIPMARLSSILLNLEFSGIVKTLPGKQYALK